MSEIDPTQNLSGELRRAWHLYVDALVPLRPALYGYCRKLTRNVWDAEDLVQDTLVRAFGRWGVTAPEIHNPRAFLLRTATNVWIDQLRRRETEANAREPIAHEPRVEAGDPETKRRTREAGSRLLQRLSPQERAALVLKETFGMTLEEIADLLATTKGAVKAALHRGRERLRADEDPPVSQRPVPSPELLDRFIDRYEAADVDGLVALLLEGASSENVGNSFHVGLDPEYGVPRFLRAVVHGHPEWPKPTQAIQTRVERAEFEGEPVLLFLVSRGGRESLQSVMRFDEQDGRIARIRSYGFCPDTMRAIGEELGMRVWTGLYRAPTPAPED